MPKYSHDELLAELHRLAEEVNRPPTLQDLREYGTHSATTYYNRFGSWQDALAAAGFETNEPNTKIPREDLLDDLRRVAELCEGTPSATDMNEHGEFWASTYRRRFGSWNSALKAADLQPTPEPQKLSEEELLAEIQRLADKYGSPPTFNEMTEHGAYGTSTYIRHFGSWSAAVEKAL